VPHLRLRGTLAGRLTGSGPRPGGARRVERLNRVRRNEAGGAIHHRSRPLLRGSQGESRCAGIPLTARPPRGRKVRDEESQRVVGCPEPETQAP
jgi:hypothetical protein